MSDDVLPLDSMVSHHSHCVRAVPAPIGVQLLFIPPFCPWFDPTKAVLAIVRLDARSTGSIAESLSTR